MSLVHGILRNIIALTCAIGLVAVAGAIGSAVLPRATGRSLGRLGYLLLRVGLGLGLLSYLAFGLGIGRVLTPAVVRASVLVIAATCGLISARKRSPGVPSAGRTEQEDLIPAWAGALAAVAGAAWLSGLVLCFTPLMDYDGLAYHVAAPARWLRLGAITYLPTHLMTQWPLGAEMLYALLLPFDGPDACKPFMALMTLLTACAVYVLGRRLDSRAAGVIGASVFLLLGMRFANPGMNSTSVDMMAAFWAILSGICLVALQPAADVPRAWLVLAAVYCGFACCARLNALMICAFLVIAVAALSRPSRTNLTRPLLQSGAFAVITVLAVSPWYVRTWMNTGNPIFPFASRLLDGRFWSASAGRVLAAHYASFNLPGAALAARHAVVVRHILRVSVLTLVGVFLPGLRWARWFTVMAGTFAVAQVALCDQWRMLLPALAPAVLVVAYWMIRLVGSREVLGWVSVAAAAVALLPEPIRQTVTNLPLITRRIMWSSATLQRVNNTAAFLWANRALPADARVLYGPDERTMYLNRDVYWSSAVFQHEIVYDSWPRFVASIRREGITYLILNRRFYADSAIAFDIAVGWRRDEQRCLEELARRSELLWTGDGVSVYRIPAELKDGRTAGGTGTSPGGRADRDGIEGDRHGPGW